MHSHGHDHGQASAKGEAGSAKPEADAKDAALLMYMLEHNRSHARELIEAADRMRDAGRGDVADRISEAAHDFEHGNESLEKAVKLLQGR
jgi:hypothetical protein